MYRKREAVDLTSWLSLAGRPAPFQVPRDLGRPPAGCDNDLETAIANSHGARMCEHTQVIFVRVEGDKMHGVWVGRGRGRAQKLC